jgi:hypothetical protein
MEADLRASCTANDAIHLEDAAGGTQLHAATESVTDRRGARWIPLVPTFTAEEETKYRKPGAIEAILTLTRVCADCREAMRHAYSDATTPGFFFDRCDKHRKKPAA